MANTAMRDGWRTSRLRLTMWGSVAAALLIPAVAMQFTDAVVWGPGDFALAALLLGGGAALFELAARRVTKPLHLAAVAGVLLLVVGTIWADAAVGVF